MRLQFAEREAAHETPYLASLDWTAKEQLTNPGILDYDWNKRRCYMHLRSIPDALWVGILAMFIAASARAQAPKEPPALVGYQTDGMMYQPLSLGEASTLEQQLAAHPDDELVRDKLLKYYWHNGLQEQRLESIFWLIEHHPESPLHAHQTAQIATEMSANMLKIWSPSGLPMNDAADFDRAVALWDEQVKNHPRDARVLFNAARMLGFSHSNEREILLAERAQQLEPASYTLALARLYTQILLQIGTELPDSSGIKEKLLSSTDSELIGLVAREMMDRITHDAMTGSNGRVPASVVPVDVTELLARAISLNPKNSEWPELMQGAKQLESKRDPVPATSQPAFRGLTISENIAKMNLISSPEPIYPVEAKYQGIDGTVRFNVRIGPDGHVKNVVLVSGQALLVNPAQEAVRQYIYRPIFLNGAAEEVIASVDVEFHLSEQH